MKKFFSPSEVIKAGRQALTNRENYLFRKRIQTESLRPYSNYKGLQLSLASLCASEPDAVVRHMRTAIAQTEAFFENQTMLLEVAKLTLHSMEDAEQLEQINQGYISERTSERTLLARETYERLLALKA